MGFDPTTNSLQGIRVKDFRDFLAVDIRFERRTVINHCKNIERFFNAINMGPQDVTKLDVRSYLHERMKEKSRATTNNTVI